MNKSHKLGQADTADNTIFTREIMSEAIDAFRYWREAECCCRTDGDDLKAAFSVMLKYYLEQKPHL